MDIPDFAGVVTGDWHIDRYNRIDDFAKCVDFVIDWSIKKRKEFGAIVGIPLDFPFFFHHTGDGYKTWHPAPIEMNVMHRTMILNKNGVEAEIVVGNHDWPESEEWKGMHCFTEMKTLGGGMDVIDLPMVKPIQSNGVLLGNRIYIPHLPKALLQREGMTYQECFKKIMNELIEQCDQTKPIILFSHCYIKEAAVGTSDLVVESDRQISVEDLKDPRLMAVFMGDIHKAQSLNDKPLVLYPGSIERIDFGESKDEKGFCYYEVRGKEIKIEFIPTPARKFLHIIANLVQGDDISTKRENISWDVPENPAEIQPWLENKLADYELKGAIVKLTIRCGSNLRGQVNDDRLVDLLKGMGAERVRTVNYDVVSDRQRRAPEIGENLTPVAALEKWVAMQDYKEVQGQSIFLAGKRLIGVEK